MFIISNYTTIMRRSSHQKNKNIKAVFLKITQRFGYIYNTFCKTCFLVDCCSMLYSKIVFLMKHQYTYNKTIKDG